MLKLTYVRREHGAICRGHNMAADCRIGKTATGEEQAWCDDCCTTETVLITGDPSRPRRNRATKPATNLAEAGA